MAMFNFHYPLINVRHFKGNLYDVIGEALHSETGETLVLYVNEKGQVFARPKKMFWDKVVNRFGHKVDRFQIIKGPDVRRVVK